MGLGKNINPKYMVSGIKRKFVLFFVLVLSILLCGNSSGNNLRFLDNHDGTVTDQATGLMWSKNAAPAIIALDWYSSLNYIAKLNVSAYAGYRDWRLPNINELSSLLDRNYYNPSLPPGHPFKAVNAWYWTGTTKAGYPEAAWRVYFFLGNIDYRPKIYTKSHTWPVRSMKTNIPRTGQVRSYYPLDDGALQIGRPWPKPRFKDNGDGTVTDQLTGLMWLKDADPTKGKKDWSQALACVMLITTRKVAGYSDWRLPHLKELQTIFDYGRVTPVLPSGHPFSNVALDWYWSQDVNIQDMRYIWCTNLATGGVDYYHREHHRKYIWPVRNYQ
ncbi:MAG TPA: DUF1566 domain-containing protein [Proteobacteria bacterium]|nr:DUF1566 domain-containing protein [Pseudomonadota bacterium]